MRKPLIVILMILVAWGCTAQARIRLPFTAEELLTTEGVPKSIPEDLAKEVRQLAMTCTIRSLTSNISLENWSFLVTEWAGTQALECVKTKPLEWTDGWAEYFAYAAQQSYDFVKSEDYLAYLVEVRSFTLELKWWLGLVLVHAAYEQATELIQ